MMLLKTQQYSQKNISGRVFLIRNIAKFLRVLIYSKNICERLLLKMCSGKSENFKIFIKAKIHRETLFFFRTFTYFAFISFCKLSQNVGTSYCLSWNMKILKINFQNFFVCERVLLNLVSCLIINDVYKNSEENMV